MNFLNKKTTWTNWEFIPLKLCIASAYLLIGMYFYDYVKAYKWPLIALFGVTWVVSMSWWIKKMRNEN